MSSKLEYRCSFPGCTYVTCNRSLIEYHHVNPRELNVTLNKNLTIPLCSCHHKLIYHPDATTGQHTNNTPESMRVEGVYNTTTGKCVKFIDYYGQVHDTYIDSKPALPTRVSRLSWTLIGGVALDIVDEVDDNEWRDIDRYGYYQFSNYVLFRDEYKNVAADLLCSYITNYMTRVKLEHESMMSNARNAWKEIKALKA